MYRYHSIMRPIAPGTFPHTKHVTDVVNFDRSQFVPEINHEALGYIEYVDPITEKQAADYELVPSNTDIIERLRASGWHNDFCTSWVFYHTEAHKKATVERIIPGTFSKVPGGYEQKIDGRIKILVPDMCTASFIPETGELHGHAPDYEALEAVKAPAVHADTPG